MVKLTPNCIIVGVQKGGTTSLFNWLAQHPNIYGPSMAKDYHFYSSNKEYNKGLSELEKRYKGYSGEKIRLHAAVNYIYKDIALNRIAKDLPNVKIIAVLRNPINRAISAYKYFTKIGLEDATFKVALKRELEGKLKEEELNDFGYLTHGLYAKQVQSLYKYFPKRNLSIFFYEDMIIDKNKVTTQLFKFLELEPFAPSFTHLNQGAVPQYRWINRFMNKENFIKKYFKHFMPLDLRIKLKYFITEKNITNKKLNIEEEIDYRFLSTYYEEDIANLSQLLKYDLKTIWQ